MDRCSLCHKRFAPQHGAWLAALALAVAGLSIFSGCDDKRDTALPLPIPPTHPTTATAPTRPSTQQLLDAKRKEIVLGSFPLTLEVPPSWKINSEGSGTWLEGETPHGDVRIQLHAQGALMKTTALLAMEKSAREQATTQPDNLEVVPLKSIGGPAKKMERREVLRNLAVVRDHGVTEHVDRVDWSILIFVPKDDGFDVDELNFSGLALDHYQQDREFIEHIIRTLHYDATGGALKN